MKICVDASVFIASARNSEDGHSDSVKFLKDAGSTQKIVCPALVLSEGAGAMARRTGSISKARTLIEFTDRIPVLLLVSTTEEFYRRAADIAARHRLRGADAIYVATAEEEGATLITWDAEMLDRGRAVVPTMTPTAWLEAQQSV